MFSGRFVAVSVLLLAVAATLGAVSLMTGMVPLRIGVVVLAIVLCASGCAVLGIALSQQPPSGR